MTHTIRKLKVVREKPVALAVVDAALLLHKPKAAVPKLLAAIDTIPKDKSLTATEALLSLRVVKSEEPKVQAARDRAIKRLEKRQLKELFK